jgi:hypothetical protein
MEMLSGKTQSKQVALFEDQQKLTTQFKGSLSLVSIDLGYRVHGRKNEVASRWPVTNARGSFERDDA